MGRQKYSEKDPKKDMCVCVCIVGVWTERDREAGAGEYSNT